MSTLAYRRNSVMRSVGSYLAPAASYTVVVYKPGAQVNGNQSSVTSVTVRAGHGLVAGDIACVVSGGAVVSNTLQAVSSVDATHVVFSTAITVADGDYLLNLGADGGTTSPDWEGSDATIYSDMAGGTSITNSQVTTDSGGEYEYWTYEPETWEVVISGSSFMDIVPVAIRSITSRVRYAEFYEGSDMGEKIRNAILDYFDDPDLTDPGDGVIVDARYFEGAQSCTVNPFDGVTWSVLLLLGRVRLTTTVPWELGNNHVVRGMGPHYKENATVLQCDSSTFPTNTYLVRIGQGGTDPIFGTRLEDMRLFCYNVTDSTAIYSTQANEGCGGRNLWINGFQKYGIHMSEDVDMYCANWLFEQCDLAASYTAAQETVTGVYIDDRGGGVIRRMTVGTSAGDKFQNVGIHVVGTSARLYDIHVEWYKDGVLFDTDAEGSVNSLSTANANNYGVRIVSDECVFLSNINAGGTLVAPTGTIYNEVTGQVITDTRIAHYATAKNGKGYQVYSSAGWKDADGFATASVTSNDEPIFSIKTTATSGGTARAGVVMLDGNNDGAQLRAIGGDTSNHTASAQVRFWKQGSVDTTVPSFRWYSSGIYEATSANDALWVNGQLSELITVAASATSDSTLFLLPVNSIIEAVVARVTVAVTCTSTFKLGDTADDDRFSASVSKAATTTATCIAFHDQTGAAGPVNATALKVRITPDTTPSDGNGRVRVTVFYRQFTAPTS